MKEGQTKTGNQTLYITVGITTLVLGGLGYWYYKRRKKNNNEVDLLEQEVATITTSSSGSNQSPVTTTSTKFRCTNSRYPLDYGTCNNDVKTLQRYLKSIYNADLGRSGSYKDGVDGMFGSKTNRAVKKHLGKVSFSKQDIEGIRRALKSIKR